MLSRIKTLPLPTVARSPRSAITAAVAVPPALLVDGPLTAPTVVDGVGRLWSVATPGAGIAAIGVAGILVGPVGDRLLAALMRDVVGVSKPSGMSTLAASGVTVLEDSDRHLAALADSVGAAECRVWLHEANELRAMAPTDAAPPAAARLAADSGLPVVIDDGGVSTWIARWCARSPSEEPTGLLALRHDGIWVPVGLVDELAAVASRLGTELSWLRIHRRIVAEHERLRAAAMIEPLTGAWTRAAFERTTEVELAAAQRRGESLSIVVFDIDGLRRINDQYGHAVGDAVLVQLTAMLRANVRINDVLGRFGDDEIALLLMNADVDRARMVAEKLVRKVLDTGLAIDGERVRFSVRAGVTGFDVGNERNGDAGYLRAIKALDIAAVHPARVAMTPVSAEIPTEFVLEEDAQVGTPIGQTLGGAYRILHEISRGANGVVYRGEDLGLGRPVAIKVLRSDLRDEVLVEHFRREASILASLHHPNLVQVYAFGASDDVYFIMELVEGPTVADVVEEALMRGDWLDPHAVAEVVTEVADALEAMHGAGLVHCDVKPENIILDRIAGRAVLVDVGECKRHDEARRRAGTPGYAAPESFSEGEETAAIDVYSLAASAYLMLTGRMPFGVADALSILARQLDAPAPPPSGIRRGLPDAVDVVIAKAMAVDPRERYRSPGAFAAALRASLRGTDGAGDAPVVMPAGQLRVLTFDGEMDVTAVSDEVQPRSLIRGAAFRVAAKVLGVRVGEPALRRIAEYRRDLSELIQPALAPMSWQSLDLLFELVAGVAGERGQPDILRTIGRGLVSVTFGHLFGADPSTMSTHGLLGLVPRLWSRYFGDGVAEVVGAGDNRVVLRVVDWTDASSATDLVVGFLERIAELTGIAVVNVSANRDGNSRLFTVEWSDDGCT